jgi:hypothetical protein
MPTLSANMRAGTCSFRPLEERGRNLKPHASNELVHIDAGAYGATNGDRILRFFVNVNPDTDRIWKSKGAFPELFERYGREAGLYENLSPTLERGFFGKLRTAMLSGLAGMGMPLATVLDSSPYDRVMRQFHNYMKDTPVFQEPAEGDQTFHFEPYSAWMVLTDMVSHASYSGQHALVVQHPESRRIGSPPMIFALNRSMRAAAMLVPILLADSPVCAQDPASGETSAVIEEIVVIARYRSENLGDVPDSITAFTAADIDAHRIERVNRVASLTPNLRFSDDQEVGVSTLIIRGVRQNRGTGQPPVSFRVDGVSATNNLLTTQDLFDIESIEVLRGPQGALYGRNAIGGAILVSTDDYVLGASASGPIGDDSTLYRASLRIQDRAGQLENAYLDGAKVDFKEAVLFRGRLLFQPSDRWSIAVTGQYADQEGGSGYFMPGSEGYLPLPPPAEPILFGNPTYEIQSNSVGVSYVQFEELSAKIDYEFDWGTLTSITSYSDVESENDQDLDQTLVDAINIEVDDNSQTFAQELRLASDADSRLRWVAGAYYFTQDRFRSLRFRRPPRISNSRT